LPDIVECWRLNQGNCTLRNSSGEHAVKVRHQQEKSGRSGRRDEYRTDHLETLLLLQLRAVIPATYISYERKQIPATPVPQTNYPLHHQYRRQTKTAPREIPSSSSTRHKARAVPPQACPSRVSPLLAFASWSCFTCLAFPWLTERTYFAWRYLSSPCAPSPSFALPTYPNLFNIAPLPKSLCFPKASHPTYHHSCRHSLGDNYLCFAFSSLLYYTTSRRTRVGSCCCGIHWREIHIIIDLTFSTSRHATTTITLPSRIPSILAFFSQRQVRSSIPLCYCVSGLQSKELKLSHSRTDATPKLKLQGDTLHTGLGLAVSEVIGQRVQVP
jgi:hypothetical protein